MRGTMQTLFLSAVSVAVLSAALPGCGGPARLPGPPPSPSAATPHASPSVTGSVQAQARQAYLAMWAAYVAASQTADYQSPSLARYAAGAALSLLTHGLLADYQARHRHEGRAVIRPAGHGRRRARRRPAGRRRRLRGQLRLERLHALGQAGPPEAAGTAAGHRPAPAVPAGRGNRVEGHLPQRRAGGHVLSRRAARAGLALAAALLLTAAAQLPALAGGNPGNGEPFGVVQCGQSAYAPGCTVTAGTPQTDGTGQASTATAASAAAPAAGKSAVGCAGTVNATFGCVPAGCQVTIQTLACPVGAAAPAGPGGGAADPGALAALARRDLVLPSPVIRSSPPQGQPQLTRLPTWLWISPAAWAPQSKTAAVPGESVTATATPAVVTWQMGNGAKVGCDGPGTAYSRAYSPSSASPDCGYTYTQPSDGQPGGAFRVTATITWDVSWAGGELAPLFTVAAADFTVTQSQDVNVTGGG